MGAEEFRVVAHGKTAEEAFKHAVENAQYRHGHDGYTGTIAEKDSFQMVPCDREDAEKLVDEILSDDDHWCFDKWGPAGCVELKGKNREDGLRTFAFFGWASS